MILSTFIGVFTNFRWDYYMEANTVLRSMNPMVAYQKGLTTWAKWVDLNLDPHKTRVIFRSVSPRHNRYHTTPSNSIYHTQNSGKQKVIIVWGVFAHAGRMVGNATTRSNL